MDKEEGVRKLKDGQLYAVMEVPEGFVQDIMNGTNTLCGSYFPGARVWKAGYSRN